MAQTAEEKRACRKAYREAHKAELREYKRHYYEMHKDRDDARNLVYYYDHREKLKAYARRYYWEHGKTKREANRDCYESYQRNYYLARRGRGRAGQEAYKEPKPYSFTDRYIDSFIEQQYLLPVMFPGWELTKEVWSVSSQ